MRRETADDYSAAATGILARPLIKCAISPSRHSASPALASVYVIGASDRLQSSRRSLLRSQADERFDRRAKGSSGSGGGSSGGGGGGGRNGECSKRMQ